MGDKNKRSHLPEVTKLASDEYLLVRGGVTKMISGNNVLFFSDNRIKEMALSMSFTIVENTNYDANGQIVSADINWADGDTGALSVEDTDDFGISEIKYTKITAGKEITVTITRDVDGNITNTTATLTNL